MIKRLKLETLDSIEFFRTGLNDHEYPTHYHDTFCISLIEKGTLCKNDLLASERTILISHPLEVHKNGAFKDNLYSHMRISLSPDLINFVSNSEHIFFEETIIYDDFLFSELSSLTKHAFEISDKKSLETNLTKNLRRLIQKYAAQQTSPKIVKNSTVEDAKQYILENLDTKISLEDLSQKFGMSKFKFIRWFKRNVGLTPFDYIILNRIENGKKMINQGKPLLETAMDTGFYDQSHFSNYFKRFVGVTPKTYQQGCNIFQDN